MSSCGLPRERTKMKNDLQKSGSREMIRESGRMRDRVKEVTDTKRVRDVKDRRRK